METVKKQPFSARIDSENHQWLKRIAAKEDRSANWVLNKLVTDARLAEDAKNANLQP